ncbi:MAG TPA: hypothetical protein VK474_11980 [Chthoniobacterales bacterium]|nr:hypothetical protein [Chthoniobacterales bacterium]
MRRAFETKRGRIARDLRTFAALTEFEDYCEEHPRSPAAVRRPKLAMRGGRWVAMLGSSLAGIIGIGETVRSALGAFDRQYLNVLHGDQPFPDGNTIRAGREGESTSANDGGERSFTFYGAP